MKINDFEKTIRILSIGTLFFIMTWELISVIAQVKPFWVDEWRVIYNLKFKSFKTIWGPLDYMQQFPRAYLELIKAFTSRFDYSYFSLRLPSYIFGSLLIALAYRLMRKIYPNGHFNRFLFIMILVSSCTFTNYYVQVKQYTMDMLLSLVAIWQFMELLANGERNSSMGAKYWLLCASFLVVPFFSYTYPIAIAPVFVIMLYRSVAFHMSAKRLFFQWLPLLLCTLSITIFYITDISQVMADENMYQFWGTLMMCKGYTWHNFLTNFFNLFASVGAGLFFWFLFGIIGIASLLYGIYSSTIKSFRKQGRLTNYLVLYSVLILALVIALSLAGKFPVGEPRLNAFTIPSISILLISLLDGAYNSRFNKVSRVLSLVFYAGVIGNIYTTFQAEITGPVYNRKMSIYNATENAIALAQAKKIPILITPGVAFPYDTTRNLPFYSTVPGDWVLKTFPAYKVAENLPVYGIKDLTVIGEYMKQLPPYMKSVLAGDGITFQIFIRQE